MFMGNKTFNRIVENTNNENRPPKDNDETRSETQNKTDTRLRKETAHLRRQCGVTAGHKRKQTEKAIEIQQAIEKKKRR